MRNSLHFFQSVSDKVLYYMNELSTWLLLSAIFVFVVVDFLWGLILFAIFGFYMLYYRLKLLAVKITYIENFLISEKRDRERFQTEIASIIKQHVELTRSNNQEFSRFIQFIQRSIADANRG